MAPLVIDIRSADDSRDVVHRAVEALAAGELVAFPTETVYGLAASALCESGVDRLRAVKGRKTGHPLPLAIKGVDDALDYIPNMSPLAKRLARRCWPGPVTLVMADNHPQSLLRQLPESVRQAVSPAGTVGLRVPAHRTILDVLRMLAGPLVLSSANRGGKTEAINAQQVVESLGDDVELVLDDGQCRYGQPSSVVRVVGDRYEMLREGVVPDKTLQRLSSMMILLVCTGNTCRSPMAEALCKGRIAKHLGCTVDEVEGRGYIVLSAGVSAATGSPAASEAVQAMADEGLDLSRHGSQPLTAQLVQQADVIYTMTQAHRMVAVAQWPEAASRIGVLCGDESDVADPVGCSLEQYKRCAAQLDEAIARRLKEFGIG